MQDFYADLAAASLEDPKDFAESVLLLAQHHLNLVAGSFYLYTPATGTLRLKAQVGFSSTEYRDFQLSIDSFVGASIRAKEPVIEPDPAGSHLFRNKQLLANAEVGGIVAAPLPLTHPPHHTVHRLISSPDPIGAICLYPRRSDDLQNLAEWATKYGPFLARLYLATLERYTMYFRSATVERAAFRRDVGSLAHAFLDLLRVELEVRAGALWVLDHRRNRLHLRRSVGRYARVKDKDVDSVVPGKGDVIGRSFTQRKSLYHSSGRPGFDQASLPKDILPPESNGAVFPIRLPDEARLGGERADIAGVLALIDHKTTVNGTTHLTDFSWEDAFLAEFGCEMLSVLLYQALRTRDYQSDFERRMHGASTALQAARSNLQFITAHYDISRHLPEAQQHYIPNAIDWIEDLEAQISRDDVVVATIKREPILLYGEVLAKIGPMVKRMALEEDTEITVLGLGELDDNYRQIPLVMADRRALDRVFRNLIENCCKYRVKKHDHRSQIAIRAWAEDSKVLVHIEDNGTGIAAEDVPFVFEDGFRGGASSGRKPQGLGRGLFECKTIMRKLKGDIALAEAEQLGGTAFRIELEAAPRRGDSERWSER
jgi:hypothetical protein